MYGIDMVKCSKLQEEVRHADHKLQLAGSVTCFMTQPNLSSEPLFCQVGGPEVPSLFCWGCISILKLMFCPSLTSWGAHLVQMFPDRLLAVGPSKSMLSCPSPNSHTGGKPGGTTDLIDM